MCVCVCLFVCVCLCACVLSVPDHDVHVYTLLCVLACIYVVRMYQCMYARTNRCVHVRTMPMHVSVCMEYIMKYLLCCICVWMYMCGCQLH